MTAPMNVLFLMADQLAPHFLPAYGHQVVKTPRLDEIAEKSLIFDAHYSNSPLCVPGPGRVDDRPDAVGDRLL